MKLYIVAVRDRAVDQYDKPMFVIAVGQAVRAFGDEVNRADKENHLYRHPEDYDLYLLGEYETTTGKIVSLEFPEQVAIGKNLVQSTQ